MLFSSGNYCVWDGLCCFPVESIVFRMASVGFSVEVIVFGIASVVFRFEIIVFWDGLCCFSVDNIVLVMASVVFCCVEINVLRMASVVFRGNNCVWDGPWCFPCRVLCLRWPLLFFK